MDVGLFACARLQFDCFRVRDTRHSRSRWLFEFVFLGLGTSTSRFLILLLRRRGMYFFYLDFFFRIANHVQPRYPYIYNTYLNSSYSSLTFINCLDPPATPNPSKSSAPTTPSPNALRTSPRNKRATQDRSKRLPWTGHGRSTGWVLGRNLVMVFGG